jgi:hypothetical protein
MTASRELTSSCGTMPVHVQIQYSEIFMLKRLQFVGLFLALLVPLLANADMPGKHPHYLQALSDLRSANWLIQHRPASAAASADESAALDEISAAYNEITRAAITDGKDLAYQPSAEQTMPGKGRLHRARDLLRKARNDVAREEDDPATRGLRDRIVFHLGNAIRATEAAIHVIEAGA